MLIVPLQSVPSQSLSVILAKQFCSLNVYQKLSGLYCDVYVSGVLVIGGVLCHNTNRIVRSLYLGFVGDFMFIDNEGSSDPVYGGLGTRYSLAYLELTDLNGEG